MAHPARRSCVVAALTGGQIVLYFLWAILIGTRLLPRWVHTYSLACEGVAEYEKITRNDKLRERSNARNIDVWLPDGYTPTKQYRVLYLDDGPGFDNSASIPFATFGGSLSDRMS
jgi:hypothetical protein